jgi:hypothetical protein
VASAAINGILRRLIVNLPPFSGTGQRNYRRRKIAINRSCLSIRYPEPNNHASPRMENAITDKFLGVGYAGRVLEQPVRYTSADEDRR